MNAAHVVRKMKYFPYTEQLPRNSPQECIHLWAIVAGCYDYSIETFVSMNCEKLLNS